MSKWNLRPGNPLEQVVHVSTSNVLNCEWNLCIFACTDGCSSNKSCGCCCSLCLFLSRCSLASPCSSVSAAILSLLLARILSSLASLCSSFLDACLSFLCFKAAALSSKVLVVLSALSLILCFLNLSSFCSAVSEAWRAFSLSLLRRSLLALISADSEDRLEVESIESEDCLEVESILPSILQTDVHMAIKRCSLVPRLHPLIRTRLEMLQSVKLEQANIYGYMEWRTYHNWGKPEWAPH